MMKLDIYKRLLSKNLEIEVWLLLTVYTKRPEESNNLKMELLSKKEADFGATGMK